MSDKFRPPRGGTPVEVDITNWRAVVDENGAPVGQKPTEILVRFGTFDVTEDKTQRKAEAHFESLYADSGWSYEWNPADGNVALTEVPALPKYEFFPEPGTAEFARLEDLARQGIIVFGPAKGGGEARVDLNTVPHTLTGGNTGRGKSVLLTIVLFWAMYLPDEYEIVVCDPKRTDFPWTAEFPNVRFAATIPDITTAVEYVAQEMDRRQSLLGRHGVENLGYLQQMARDGAIAAEEAPPRLILFFDEMASFFTDSKDEEIIVLQGNARSNVEQIAQLGRASGVNLFGGAQKPTDKNLGTLIRELMGNKLGIGWMKANMSEQALGSNLCTLLDRRDTPPGRGWCLVEGEDDQLFQTYYLPKRTEPVHWAAGQPTVPGVLDIVRQRLTDLGYVQVEVPNEHGSKSPRWLKPEKVET